MTLNTLDEDITTAIMENDWIKALKLQKQNIIRCKYPCECNEEAAMARSILYIAELNYECPEDFGKMEGQEKAEVMVKIIDKIVARNTDDNVSGQQSNPN